MESSFFYLNLVYGTPLLFLGSAFVFIASIPKRYTAWKKTGRSNDFTHWVVSVLFGTLMLSVPFVIYLAYARQFLTDFSANHRSDWITIPAYSLLFAVIPAINVFFGKFQETKKPVYFGLSMLMVVVVLFFFVFAAVGLVNALQQVLQ